MTRRALVLALLSFGLLVAALAARNGDLALLALPFLTYLGAGILTAPAPEVTRLRAERSVDTTPSGDVVSVRVQLKIRNEGTPAIALKLAEPIQAGMKVTESDFEQREDGPGASVALDGGEEAERGYTFEAARGSFRWQSLRVAASDSFGLFERELALPAPAGLEIRPKIRKLRPVALPPGSTLHSPGSLPAHRAGSGTDFWGVREYRPGDPLRRLDWRLAARHPRRFFTKEFEQEEIADIGLILDARQKTEVRLGDESLFEHTAGATASLAEALLHQGHRVSLLVLGDRITTVFPGYSKVQLNRILRCLAKTRPGSTDSRLGLDYLPLGMFSSSALLVILSPLAPGDWRLFPRLRARGNQGLLICPDTIAFALPSFAQDPAAGLGVRAARAERRLELRRIAQLQVRVIDWQVDQPLSPLLGHVFRIHPRAITGLR